jgi:uncharacterized protein (DUF433 family)
MDESSYIAVIPGVLDGKAHIAGRRITVHHIAMWKERMGMSPEQIAVTFEIPLPAVHAALEHYRRHREGIDREINSEGRWTTERYLDGYRPDDANPSDDGDDRASPLERRTSRTEERGSASTPNGGHQLGGRDA